MKDFQPVTIFYSIPKINLNHWLQGSMTIFMGHDFQYTDADSLTWKQHLSGCADIKWKVRRFDFKGRIIRIEINCWQYVESFAKFQL